MSYPIKYPTPQGANIQIFNQGGSTSDWVKPQGASFIWVTLIGAGGGGGNGSTTVGGGGGGSGAVTNYMGPAFLIPDVLRVYVGKSILVANATDASTLTYQQKDGAGYTLLTANGGETAGNTQITGGNGATASVSNYFSCMGFFQSVAGQSGTDGSSTSAGVNQAASATTFLSGGAGGGGGTGGGTTGGGVTANYGYVLAPTTAGGTVKGRDGVFMMQPIIVGVGGTGGTTTSTAGTVGGNGGIGCGGGGAGEDAGTGGLGGDGMVVIITW
jgi:hypothetical protein